MMDTPFSIGRWKIEPALNRATGEAGTQSVEPRAMRVLVQLVRASGNVVTRDALLAEVWAGAVVTEHSLTIAISDLRKLLGDDPAHPSYIETVRGVGYRMIAEVTVHQPAPKQPPGNQAKAPVISFRSSLGLFILAVLFVALLGVRYFSQPPQTEQLLAIRPLTTLPGVELSPGFSPDGQRVVFVAFTESGAPADLYVQQLDADAPVRLTDLTGAELLPAWSPDGQWIAFQRYGPNGCALYKVPSIGGTPVKILEITCRLAGLKWAPDGTSLIYAAAEAPGQPMQLFKLPLDDLEAFAISNPPSTIRGDIAPTVSPDGSVLAFVRVIDGSAGDLYLLGLNDPDAQPERLSYDGVSITGFDWTEDGQALVFASNREQQKGIWKIDIAGDKQPTLIQAISVDDPGNVVLARRGNQMVYVDWTFEVNTWRKSLKGNEDYSLLQSTRIDAQPDVTADGSIAFVSTRTGVSEIWIAGPDGANPQKRTTLNQHGTNFPKWSPDEKWIAYQSNNNGQSDLYIVDATGGAPQLITKEQAQDVRPFWSPDGKSLYFGSDRSGEWQIWRQRVDENTAEQITSNGGLEAQLSADGNKMFFTQPAAAGIWVMDLPNGEASCLFNQPVLDWALAPGAIYIAQNSWKKGVLDVKRFDLASGEVTEVANLTMNPAHLFFSRGFTVSPDENWLLYSQVDRSESNLMLASGHW